MSKMPDRNAQPAVVRDRDARGRDASSAGTVARVVKLLTCIAEAEGEVSIKYLCQELNLPASTVHRLLGLMIENGIIERAPVRALYGPGLELLRVSSLLAAKVSIVDLARPIMRSVVAASNQTCVLLRYIPSSRKVMAVHAEYSSNPLRYQIELFQPHSLLWGATGRSVLAFLPRDEIEAALKDADLSPATGVQLPSQKAMMNDLGEIRGRGFSMTQGQKIAGAVGHAAPLFNSESRVIGCLSITIPKANFDKKAESQIPELLLEHAEKLNRALGFERRNHVRPPY